MGISEEQRRGKQSSVITRCVFVLGDRVVHFAGIRGHTGEQWGRGPEQVRGHLGEALEDFASHLTSEGTTDTFGAGVGGADRKSEIFESRRVPHPLLLSRGEDMKCSVWGSGLKGRIGPKQHSRFVICGWTGGLREREMVAVTLVSGLHSVLSPNAS